MILSCHQLIAFDCIPTSDRFIDNLNERQLIIHVKIIEQHKYENSKYRIYGFKGLTVLEVINSFRGKLWRDTLVHQNYNSAGAGTSLLHYNLNQELFLKAYLVNSVNTVNDLAIVNKEELTHSDSIINEVASLYPNIDTGTCDVAIIPVVDGNAKGRITKKISKQWRRYKFLSKIKEEWAERYYDNYILNKDTEQKVSIKSMYRIIESRMKAYR